MINIEDDAKEDEIKTFFWHGVCNLLAAKKLFSDNPYFMFPAIVLAHNGIELLLKGWWIWSQSTYSYTHDLFKISKEIPLKLDEQYENLLKKINTYLYLRYPMDAKKYTRTQQILSEIGDEFLGIPTTPLDLGKNDLQNVLEFSDYLIERMPSKLRILFDEESKKLNVANEK